MWFFENSRIKALDDTLKLLVNFQLIFLAILVKVRSKYNIDFICKHIYFCQIYQILTFSFQALHIDQILQI
jgi:hypothetical protein